MNGRFRVLAGVAVTAGVAAAGFWTRGQSGMIEALVVVAAYAVGLLRGRSQPPARNRAPAGTPEIRLYNMGTLAMMRGYLRHDQVLEILRIQQREPKLFGKIAVEQGLLLPDQVDELLRLQGEHRSGPGAEAEPFSGSEPLATLSAAVQP